MFILKLFSLCVFLFASNLFTETYTIDGEKVHHIPLSQEQMERRRHTVAFTDYDNSGAYIYYDVELFSKISAFAKFLIIEHERAHHTLGHTLVSKKLEEANDSLMQSKLHFKKENDADCESGFRARKLYPGLDTNKIKGAMKEIFVAMGGNEKENPSWLLSRIDKIITCFDGKLLKRPKPIESL